MHVTKSSITDIGEEPNGEEDLYESREYDVRLSQLAAVKSYFENYNTIEKSFIDMFTGKNPKCLSMILKGS